MDGLRLGANPSLGKSGLDAIVFEEYNKARRPEFGSVLDPKIFNQVPVTDRNAMVMETFRGVGKFSERAESQDAARDSVEVANTATYKMLNFDKDVAISKNKWDDRLYNDIELMMRDVGRKAQISREDFGMGLFRDAFAGATFKTAAGVAPVSDSHTTISGDTVDNKLTAALSESSLNSAIVALRTMKDESGVVGGYEPSVLLVPAALYKTACEILDSELRSGTGNNDLNVYSSKYGIELRTSQYLDSSSTTAWFLLGDFHTIMRFERQGLETALTDWTVNPNRDYIYKAGYREQYGIQSFAGLVGSTGEA